MRHDGNEGSARRKRVTVAGLVLAAGVMMGMTGCRWGEGAGAVERVQERNRSAAELLGDAQSLAMSYSGWRTSERRVELCPTVDELKEDLRLMHALGVRLIRTYNTTGFPQAERILQAIEQLKAEESGFEMYVMLGAWIQRDPNQSGVSRADVGDMETNSREIARAIELAAEHPSVVKIIAVGNEAMVTWQPHHVVPEIIHRWVNELREARDQGRIRPDVWITTSDNWAALGGEDGYRKPALVELLAALDYVSLHTYAFHDTYYQDDFSWAVAGDRHLSVTEQRERAVSRAIDHQKNQVQAVRNFLDANRLSLAIHIGETGWATKDDSHYGDAGTRAADEFTMKLFHDGMRDWTASEGMSCFYFQGFDEPWKSSTSDGSEAHFGLFTVDGQAKFVVWDLVDAGVFDGLGRNGQPVAKTWDGDSEKLIHSLKPPVAHKFDPSEGE